MQSSYIDSVLGVVTLNESHRARNVSIRIGHSKGNITLTYPIGYDKARAIAFLEQKRESVIKVKMRHAAACKTNPPALSFDLAELRAAAREYLPLRIAQIAQESNLKYNKVSLRASRSRWGSCSSQNNISLSIYLMILPKHLIDFVIIHELCHTVHHNHSSKFHALVDYICSGREKEFERELRTHSIR